jgi:hypothetical protein
MVFTFCLFIDQPATARTSAVPTLGAPGTGSRLHPSLVPASRATAHRQAITENAQV